MRSPDALPPAGTIIRTSQRRSSRAGRSVAAPPRPAFPSEACGNGQEGRRDFTLADASSAPPQPRDCCFVARASPRVPRRRRVARTVKGQWAKQEARHGRRRGALFIWTRETRPRNARGGRGPRRGGWHLTRGDLKGEHGKESERHPRSAWSQSPGTGGQAGQVQGAARLRPL